MNRSTAARRVTVFEAWLIPGLGLLLLYALAQVLFEEPTEHIAGDLALPLSVAMTDPDTVTLFDAATGVEVGSGGLGLANLDGEVAFSGEVALADRYEVRVGDVSATATLDQLDHETVRLTHSSSSSE